MMKKDEIAIITGANRGLGYAMTEKLASLGCKVYAVCRDEKKGLQAVKKLKSQKYDVILKIADVEDPQAIEKLYTEISAETSHIDILINNAGVNIDSSDTRIENISLDILERAMNINFRGTLLMCQKFIPLLKKSDSGRIINVSSGLGQLAVPRMGYYPSYSISKTAVNGITKNLAHELKDTRILVFSVDPGWVKTDLGGPQAPLSIEEGIVTPIFLATEPANNLISGMFYKEKQTIDW